MTSGMPASRKASKPAPIASFVTTSSALLRSSSMPYSDDVEGTGAGRELDDLTGVVDGLEAAGAVLALDQPNDVLVDHPRSEAGRDQVDELLAAKDLGDVHVVED